MITLSPAYGADYDSASKAQQAFKDGKDFIIEGPPTNRWIGLPASINDLIDAGETTVRIRYKKKTAVTTVNIVDLKSGAIKP